MQNGVCVTVMARNEGNSLESLLPSIPAIILGRPVSVALVNDGSDDHTCEVGRVHGLSVLDLPKAGLSKAIRRGIAHAYENGFPYVITMDGDGQHCPRYLEAIVEKLETQADVVLNSRYRSDSPRKYPVPLDRQLLNIQVTAAVRRITGVEFSDPLCGLRGYRRGAMEFLLQQEFVTDQYTDGHGFVLESLLRIWHSKQFHCVELAHPAIYNGNGKIRYIYQDEHLDERLERFKIHARHLVVVARALGLELA